MHIFNKAFRVLKKKKRNKNKREARGSFDAACDCEGPENKKWQTLLDTRQSCHSRPWI